jgi:septal ring factor EnvC (AmiA/AmiB activator)
MLQRAATLLVIGLAVPLAAQPTDRERAEELAEQAATRLRALTKEADSLASEARSLLGDLRALELDRQIKAEELRRVDAEATAAEDALTRLDEEVRDVERQRRAEQPKLEARLVDLYKLGNGRYLRLFLSASDIREAAQASRIVAVLAKRDRDQLVAQQRRIDMLEASRAALDQQSRELEELRVAAQRAQSAANRAVRRHEALLRDINDRRDLNAQLAGELQLTHAQLQQALRALPGTGPEGAPRLPLVPFRGDLDWPVTGSARTRWQATTTLPGGGRVASNGIEIAADEGAPVQAIHGGAVAFADTFTGFGRLVIIDHGDQNFSVYGHLLDIGVEQGAQVERTQSIGRVGAPPTGAPGLYFELRIDGRPVDPLQWLRPR